MTTTNRPLATTLGQDSAKTPIFSPNTLPVAPAMSERESEIRGQSEHAISRGVAPPGGAEDQAPAADRSTLRFADLRGADLSDADLTGADLRDADM